MENGDGKMADTQNQFSDAIIFIPGVKGQPLDNAAFRIASALDIGAQTAAAEFHLEAGQEEDYASHEGKGLKTRLRTIRRLEPGIEPRKVVDIYEFSFSDSLTKEYSDKNVLKQGFRLLLLLIMNTPRLLGAFHGKKQKTTLEKLQYIIAIGILSLLIGYLILLGFAVVDTFQQIPQVLTWTAPVAAAKGSNGSGQIGTNQQPDTGPKPAIPQLLIIIFAAIEVFYPNLKQSFIEAAVLWISIIDYLGFGSRSQALGGHLSALVDHVAARGYRRIHIVAYSFGTIVALDSLFPTGHMPVARIREIHTFVTIGCPFDLIRVFWPDYFKERVAAINVPKSWINIYSPIDVMASNFRDDSEIGEPEPDKAISAKDNPFIKLIPQMNIVWNVGGPKKRLSLFEFLTLIGLEAHRSYWETEFESESTAFSPIIEELYRNDFPLA
jgi:hypothetical protein